MLLGTNDTPLMHVCINTHLKSDAHLPFSANHPPTTPPHLIQMTYDAGAAVLIAHARNPLDLGSGNLLLAIKFLLLLPSRYPNSVLYDTSYKRFAAAQAPSTYMSIHFNLLYYVVSQPQAVFRVAYH